MGGRAFFLHGVCLRFAEAHLCVFHATALGIAAECIAAFDGDLVLGVALVLTGVTTRLAGSLIGGLLRVTDFAVGFGISRGRLLPLSGIPRFAIAGQVVAFFLGDRVVGVGARDPRRGAGLAAQVIRFRTRMATPP